MWEFDTFIRLFLGKLFSNSFLPSPTVSLKTRIILPYCLIWDLLPVHIGQDHLELAGVSSQSSPSNFGKRFKCISHSTYNKPRLSGHSLHKVLGIWLCCISNKETGVNVRKINSSKMGFLPIIPPWETETPGCIWCQRKCFIWLSSWREILPPLSQEGLLDYFTRLQILHLFFNSSWGLYKDGLWVIQMECWISFH